MKQYRSRLPALFLILLLLFCSGCGESKSPGSGQGSSGPAYVSGQTQVLSPSADQKVTQEEGPLILDFSNASQGYFMGKLTQPDKKINIQVIGPDQVTYKYFLEEPEVFTAFPFTAGSGSYLILAFENVGGDQYASLLTCPLEVTLDNEFLPFLYPNQYVDFTDGSRAVQLAAEISADAASDLEALKLIYKYVTEHVSYDSQKAETVENGYLPDIDETLETGMGICFDYAALTVSMLRSLSIPARLDIGYSGDIRHAWITVYIQSVGWVDRIIEFNGDEWKLMDPTFASTFSDKDVMSEYIGDGSNYVLQYVR